MDVLPEDEIMTSAVATDATKNSMEVDDANAEPLPKLDDNETDNAATSDATQPTSVTDDQDSTDNNNNNMETSGGVAPNNNENALSSMTDGDGSSHLNNAKLQNNPELMVVSMVPEEEAQMVIEMLRSDDVADRVAAAHRLTDVASAIGPERAREVCNFLIFGGLFFRINVFI